ncbi:hypothetical protein [Mesobacterium pallidum]|uniref:hypothetical protein n=1 Tax=Mesobacterium pallidum TaxID=2872037 RepID=UPI001EE2449C|nr:hypothetical protein [Mesobacterium pallidum]
MRPLFPLLALCLPVAALAQEAERDSLFADYQDFRAYIDSHMMQRDFIPMIQRLGGRDEYTMEQLSQVNTQLLTAFPADFTDVATVRSIEMAGGFREEAYAYWNGLSYAWFYALLHERADDLVVIQFNVNSNASIVLDKF